MALCSLFIFHVFLKKSCYILHSSLKSQLVCFVCIQTAVLKYRSELMLQQGYHIKSVFAKKLKAVPYAALKGEENKRKSFCNDKYCTKAPFSHHCLSLSATKEFHWGRKKTKRGKDYFYGSRSTTEIVRTV